MPVSQNGYPANDRSLITTIRVGRNKVPIPVRRGVVAEVFVAFFDEYDRTVEPLEPGQCWGYAVRPIRGSTTGLSNHASGTAVDGNSLKHMRGVKNTFTKAQKARVRKLLSYLSDPEDDEPVLRWGEDYVSSPVDGMHYEVWKANEAALRRALNRFNEMLEREKNPAEPEEPQNGGIEAPKFPLKKGEFFYYADGDGPAVSGLASRLPNGKVGHPGLLSAQRRLRDRGWDVTIDGIYGEEMERIIRLFQAEKKIWIDGKIGPETWTAIWQSPVT